MNNKIWQFADGIHGTIFVSELERLMMATPFFYRLHDVYQSSTVYMTFPSNRTKRYEHSLGTMELAGRMFFSAVNNASAEDKIRFLRELNKQFHVILKGVTDNRNSLQSCKLYCPLEDELDALFPRGYSAERAYKDIQMGMANKTISDFSLKQLEVCFFDLLAEENNSISSEEPTDILQRAALYAFLYQCTLEALRIAALFHDIGHPPFSHIIEHILSKLYQEYSSSSDQFCDNERVKDFIDCIERYRSDGTIESLLLDLGNQTNPVEDPALHEKIGLSILYNSYKSILQDALRKLAKVHTHDPHSTSLRALYLVTVLEFTFGILLEKTPMFQSIHHLIAGPVDADRMDYVMRDTHNAGVDWGEVPYSRLIGAVKLVYDHADDDKLKLAFPEKVCDDIDDLLESRYKIFQRINFHHKSVKTSELLQRSVEMLARDYLESGNQTKEGTAEKAIAPDICYLWENLNVALGMREKENQISQWTDSWLISVLSRARDTLTVQMQDLDLNEHQIDLELLKNTLEEVQLNRKHYYPLLKRQRDAIALTKTVTQAAGLAEDNLDKLKTHEMEKLLNSTKDDGAADATDSLYRIKALEDRLIETADLGIMDIFFPGDKSCKEIIEDDLDEFKRKGLINDYFLWENSGTEKFGISEEITLYHRDGTPYAYDIETSLKRKLNAQRAGCLWMFAYVSFAESVASDEQRETKRKEILDRIGQDIGIQLYKVMHNLCGYADWLKEN